MPTEAFGTTTTKKERKKERKDESPGAVSPSKHEKTGKYWFGQNVHLGFSIICYKNLNERFGQPNAIRIDLFRTLVGEKDLHDPENHNGVITHLEPDILECEIKWALEQSQWRWWDSSWSISNPKRWCCESAAPNMPGNLENSTVAIGLEKVSFHSSP